MTLSRNGGAATAQLLVRDFGLSQEKVKISFTIPDLIPAPLPAVLASGVTTSADGLTLTVTGDVTGSIAAGDAVFVSNNADAVAGDRDDDIRLVSTSSFGGGSTSIVLLTAVKAALRSLANAKLRKSNYTNNWDTAANKGHGNGAIFVQAITDGAGNPSGDTNNDARFQSLALGKDTNQDTRSGAEKDTGLGAEFTTGGVERITGGNVKTYLVDDTANSDATKRGWWACWKGTWTLTADRFGAEAISEMIVSNGRVASRGFSLMRQTFAEGLEGKNGDKFTVVMIWKGIAASASQVEGDGTAVRNVVTYEGIREICRLLMSPKTTRAGEAPSSDPLDHNGVGGGKVDWLTDYTINTVASYKPRPFDAIALGNDKGSTISVARSNTKLGSEHTTLGGTRAEGVQGGGTSTKFLGVRGTLMQAPTDEPYDSTNEVDAFGSDTFTVFAGDTVQWAAAFKFTGTIDVDEYAVTQGTTANQGVYLCRITNGPQTLDFDDRSRHTPFIRFQVVIPTIP